MSLFIDIIGWIGAALVLLAYALVSTNRVRAQSAVYQWLNIVGALGLVVNSGWSGAIPSAVVNLVWIGIGVYSLRQVNR
jgi:formate hydrogenlyase subunit 3/multisubunit Na+/H+ antiporter MnhD subunit